MSKSETETSEEGLRKRLAPNLDDLTKMLTLVVAIIGVGKYFYDKADSAEADRRSRAIGYIEQYAEPGLLAARQSLYDFWAGQPELVEALRQDGLSERSYRMMLQASVFRHDADTTIHGPLLMLDSFYSQISYCRSGGLCDPGILDAYFCDVAKKYAVAYGPFYARLRDRSGDQSLGTTITDYAVSCQS